MEYHLSPFDLANMRYVVINLTLVFVDVGANRGKIDETSFQFKNRLKYMNKQLNV